MRSHGRFLLSCAPALSALLLACGCSLPGTFGVSSEPTPSPTKTGTPHPLLAPAPSANSVAPVTGPGPAPVLPLNLGGPESPQDIISLQAQKLNDAVTDHNLLAARVLQLDSTLQEKQRELVEATQDVRGTLDEIGRVRTENQRLRQQVADLREQLKKKEDDERTLKDLIKELEKQNAPSEQSGGGSGKE